MVEMTHIVDIAAIEATCKRLCLRVTWIKCLTFELHRIKTTETLLTTTASSYGEITNYYGYASIDNGICQWCWQQRIKDRMEDEKVMSSHEYRRTNPVERDLFVFNLQILLETVTCDMHRLLAIHGKQQAAQAPCTSSHPSTMDLGDLISA
jgi:hypothetical protein